LKHGALNTLKKLSKHLPIVVFMLSGRLKFPFCLLLFLIFSDTSHAYQFGLQYQAESTYRNTVGSFLVIPVLSKSDWTLEAASAVFISSKDW